MSIPQPNPGVPSSVAENKQVDDFKIIPETEWTDAPTESEVAVVETPPPAVPDAPAPVEQKVEGTKEQNFEAFRNEIKDKISKIDELERARQSERQLYEQELALLKGQLHQNHASKESRKEGVLGQYEDDYVPSVREIRQAFQENDKALREKIDELETMQAYPDYQKVLQEDLIPFIKDKPHFAQMIAQAPNKARTAYELGLMARQAKTPVASPAPVQQQEAPKGTPPSEIAQRIVDNANKPMTLANAGGFSSPLSKADYYASMPEEDFLKLAAQHMANI